MMHNIGWVVIILWTVAAFAYIVWSLDSQFKKNKGIAKMPPQHWWEYPIIAPAYVLVTTVFLVYYIGCALLYCVSFSTIDVGGE